ncbi:EcsC family protein [Jeotgalibacillus proteolyticus]|uniref:ABC transporter substrate-binding protein n=1 Tax=Jeotgalibacillus proteolyticus TaxID=2082395 RepID=A0A2S5GF20_9BACL|nr:EcsC family protein [Jeotgalibacillus proteolyticus]PPA71637.1 ABC transporter substrate-binding protein [Jeotgalibacillus proteolyticus]
MSWTVREQEVFEGISNWRNDLGAYRGHDLSHTFSRWLDASFASLPESLKEEVFTKLDSGLFHLHSIIQGTHLHKDTIERLMATAQAFDERVTHVTDLKQLRIDQLHYMAVQQSGRHKIYSFLQGGVAGTGGIVAFGTDLLAITILNIRAIQFIASAYGRDVQTPYEMTLSLKLFHAATLPIRYQAEAWDELVSSLETYDLSYFFTGDDELTNEKWLEGPMKQLFKSTAISLFRKKKISNLPVVSMSIGALSNYQLTRRITDFAEKFYQYRFLMDKKTH